MKKLICFDKKMTHALKETHGFFNAVLDGRKTFEFRRNDRDFKVGDTLILREWSDIQVKEYSGREIHCEVSYYLDNFEGMSRGYCALGLKNVRLLDNRMTPSEVEEELNHARVRLFYQIRDRVAKECTVNDRFDSGMGKALVIIDNMRPLDLAGQEIPRPMLL